MAARSMVSLSSSSSLGIQVSDEEMEDEERLARLLVQAAPTVATPAVVTASDSRTTPSLVKPHLSTSVSSTTLETTLMEAMPMEDDAAAPSWSTLTITHSRRCNDHLAKYVHLRSLVHTKRVKEGAQPVREPALEWMCCGCRTYNFVGRKTCRRCKQRDVDSFKHNFPPARHIPLFPSVWVCHPCGHTNRSEGSSTNYRAKFFCEGCGERFGGIREWYCPSCNHINSRGSTECATCYEARPNCWSCSSCKHEKNSIFSTECRNCRTVRRKLVSDSTSLCPVCRQRNDVQWELCFACMVPLGMMSTVKKFQGRFAAQTESVEVPSTTTETPEVVHVEGVMVSRNGDEDYPSVAVLMDADAAGKEEEEKKMKKVKPSHMPDGEGQLPKKVKREASLSREMSVESTSQSQNDDNAFENSETEESGSWWCKECKVLQRRNVSFCDICLKPRSRAESKKTEVQSGGSNAMEEWKCGKCAHRNMSVISLHCEKCQEPREQEKRSSEQFQKALVSSETNVDAAAGQWRCPYCRNLVDVMVTSCCGAHREIPSGYWLCPTCCSTNRNERVKCLGCAGPPPENPWRCLMCRHKNKNGVFLCARCGSANPYHWQCEKCGARCQQTTDTDCHSCGATKPSLEVLSCQHCCTQNHPCRKTCFRCWARLSSDKWKCSSCSGAENEKQARRCNSCGEPRQHNMEEITWICDVCNTPVASGGDLTKRTQCPRCSSDRTDRCMHFPSRWRCRSCGVANMYAVSACSECAGRRILENMHTHTSCTICFRLSVLNEQELCEHCGADLSHVLNEVGSFISLSGFSQILSVPSPCGEPKQNSGIAAPVSSLIACSQNNMMQKELHEETDVVLGEHCEVVGTNRDAEAASLFMGFENEEGTLVAEDDDGDAIETAENTVDETDLDGCSSIPSWMCGNCEASNLEDAEACAACGLRRGDE